MGRGGDDLVVRMLAFDSDDQSSNPAEVYVQFSCTKCVARKERK